MKLDKINIEIDFFYRKLVSSQINIDKKRYNYIINSNDTILSNSIIYMKKEQGDKVIDFSNKEREVMEIFWRENRELTVSELEKMSPNGTLKLNSIYLYINSLLKKGAIKVSGFVPAVRTHARTYRAMFTEADYVSIQITGQISSRANSENLKQIILTAIQSGSMSKEALDELQELIDQQREELKK